jgi:hypothetical protein
VLICFGLLLDHEDRMVEQKQLEFFLVTSTTTLIEGSLVNELSMFIRQMQILFLTSLVSSQFQSPLFSFVKRIHNPHSPHSLQAGKPAVVPVDGDETGSPPRPTFDSETTNSLDDLWQPDFIG